MSKIADLGLAVVFLAIFGAAAVGLGIGKIITPKPVTTYSTQCVTYTGNGLLEVFRADNVVSYDDAVLRGVDSDGTHFFYTVPDHVLCRAIPQRSN